MTIQEAKFILQAYRPNGEDAADPQFAEALQLAKLDPELGKWLAEQIAFDGAASRALKEIKPPTHLRESILAGQRVIEPEFWWKQPAVWAMAALFILLLGLAGFWFMGRNTAGFAAYQRDMTVAAATTDMTKHLGFVTNDIAQMEVWLAAKGIETNYSLPTVFSKAPGMGCQVLSWKGRNIAMLCYVFDGKNHVDLFIAEKNDFTGAVPGDKPQFAISDGSTIASWSQADKVYLLVGHGHVDEKLLREYIDPHGVAEWPREDRFRGRDRRLLHATKFFRAFRWNKCEVAASDSRRASGG